MNFELAPSRTLTVWWFDDVTNVGELKAAATDSKAAAVAYIDPLMVSGSYSLCVAARKAIEAQCVGKLRTGSLGREVLFSLHNSRNVGEALRLFGVKDESQSVIVIAFDADPLGTEWAARVKGRARDVSALGTHLTTDATAALLALYKLSEVEVETFGLEMSVISRISTRDV